MIRRVFGRQLKKIMPGESKGVLSCFEINGKICTDKKQIAKNRYSSQKQSVGLFRQSGQGQVCYLVLLSRPSTETKHHKLSNSLKFLQILYL